MLIYSQIAWKKSCDYLLIIYVQKFQTNSWQFVFILPYGVHTLHLKESDWTKHLSTCLYFVACFYFSVWHYPLTLNEDTVALTKPVRHFFFGTVFQGACQSFLISCFCTNFVFLHSKKFKFGINWLALCQSERRNFLYVYVYYYRSVTHWVTLGSKYDGSGRRQKTMI